MSRLFRDAVLELAKTHAFARALVNSGRLSTPATLRDSPLNTADADAFDGAMVPGAPAADAPVTLPGGARSWLLRQLGSGFTLLAAGAVAVEPTQVDGRGLPLTVLRIGMELGDPEGLVARRYDLRPGTAYLLRPDQHVCARWRSPDAAQVNAAIRRALALA
jgi:3-(3-hydroxy-phenyl)propionate hydroxylase